MDEEEILKHKIEQWPMKNEVKHKGQCGGQCGGAHTIAHKISFPSAYIHI